MEQSALRCDVLPGSGGYKPRLTATCEEGDRGNSCVGSNTEFKELSILKSCDCKIL